MDRFSSKNMRRQLVSPWFVVLVLCLLYLTAVYVVNEQDSLTFVTLGTLYSEGLPDGTEGYDGQFTYYIAADPFHAADRIDVPAYRYQRILLPLLARILSLGHVPALPLLLVGINLVALAGGTFVFERLLAAENASRWYALTYGLFVGTFMSVRLSLSEPLAYSLVILAIWLERDNRPGVAALTLAMAALAKETTLLFVGGYVFWLLLQRRWRAAGYFAGVPGVVFVTWQFVLMQWLGSPGVGSGGAMASGFELIPFSGFARILTDSGSIAAFALFALLLLPSAILPSLWALWRSGTDILRWSRHPYAVLLFVNAAIMPFVPFSTYREPLGMLRFITGLVVSTTLYGAHQRSTRVLRACTLWIVLILFAVVSQ